MTPETLKTQELIVLECLSGSRAYGLATADSDTDIRGVFVAPKNMLYGFEYPEQVANATQDIVYFEVGKWFALLAKNNPAALELLFSPPDCVQLKSPLLNTLNPVAFLSQQCEQTFAGYAMSQIKKARGLNKKINQPPPPKRHTVLDCCFVTVQGKTQALQPWLKAQKLTQQDCGLVNLPHMPQLYALYIGANYKGVVSNPEQANDVNLSSVPKGESPITYLYFNQDLYKKRCREYKEYQQWVKERNPKRYQHTLAQGKQYDAKNMMHTHRLLDLAHDIATEHTLNLLTPHREFLLNIKAGKYDYQELVDLAQEKVAKLPGLYKKSGLPKRPDRKKIQAQLVAIREGFYGG